MESAVLDISLGLQLRELAVLARVLGTDEEFDDEVAGGVRGVAGLVVDEVLVAAGTVGYHL